MPDTSNIATAAAVLADLNTTADIGAAPAPAKVPTRAGILPLDVLAAYDGPTRSRIGTVLERCYTDPQHQPVILWAGDGSYLFPPDVAAGLLEAARCAAIVKGWQFNPRSENSDGTDGLVISTPAIGSAPDALRKVVIRWRTVPPVKASAAERRATAADYMKQHSTTATTAAA